MEGGLITTPASSRSSSGDPRLGWRGYEGKKTGKRNDGGIDKSMWVRRVWDDWVWGSLEGTGAIFNTRIDHRGVLERGFQGLCYSLLVVSSATGAEVEKSTSLFNTTRHVFGQWG